MIIARTERMQLETWSRTDVHDAHRLWSDPRVMRQVGPVHEHAERSRRAIEAAMEAQRRDGVCLWRLRSHDGAFLGCCGFHRYDGPGSTRPGTRWLELAYHLLPEHWGRGYATEAARACLSRASALGATHVVAFTAPSHRASERVLDKLGFSPAGTIDGQHRYLRAP